MMPMSPRHKRPSCAINSSVTPSLKYLLAGVAAQVAERQYRETKPRRACDARRLWCDARILWRGDQTIAAAWHGLDERRLVGILAERGAQSLDRSIETVLVVDESAFRPETSPQLFARDDSTAVLEQQTQDLEGLSLQPDARRAAAQFTRMDVELERAKAQWVRCVHTQALSAGWISSLSTAPRSASRARDSLDITVPIGISIASASSR